MSVMKLCEEGEVEVNLLDNLGSGGTAARAAPGGYPSAGGYGDDYGNGGGGAGAASQLLNLIRSVRTVMRGNHRTFPLDRHFPFLFLLVPLIVVNVITIILLVLFG